MTQHNTNIITSKKTMPFKENIKNNTHRQKTEHNTAVKFDTQDAQQTTVQQDI